MDTKVITVYFDGAKRPSKFGTAQTCFVVISEDKVYVKQDKIIGQDFDSMGAEWLAFYSAIKYCTDNNLNNIHFLSDCLSVVEMAWDCVVPKAMKQKEYKAQFEEMDKPENFQIDHVRRDINLAGIVLDDGEQSRHFKNKLFLLEGIETS